jgi:hypothetical protein
MHKQNSTTKFQMLHINYLYRRKVYSKDNIAEAKKNIASRYYGNFQTAAVCHFNFQAHGLTPWNNDGHLDNESARPY